MDKENYNKLNKKEKKELLANDLIERIIRVEQRVSFKFGNLLHYKETEIYKSLNSEQKKSYEDYIKNNKKNRAIAYSLFLAPLFIIALLNFSFTGNVINESIVEYGFLDYLFLVIIFGCILGLFCFYYFKKRRKNRLDVYVDVIDSVFLRKIRKSI